VVDPNALDLPATRAARAALRRVWRDRVIALAIGVAIGGAVALAWWW